MTKLSILLEILNYSKDKLFLFTRQTPFVRRLFIIWIQWELNINIKITNKEVTITQRPIHNMYMHAEKIVGIFSIICTKLDFGWNV